MNTLIIFDSQFGNTEKVAQTIAASLSAKAIKLSETASFDIAGIGALIIGSPTQGGRATVAVNKFLDSLTPGSLKNIKVAAFDTRLLEKNLNFALKLLVKTIGYAAPKIAKILESKGGQLFVPPKGFFVEGTKGPLIPGELEKAKAWLKT